MAVATKGSLPTRGAHKTPTIVIGQEGGAIIHAPTTRLLDDKLFDKVTITSLTCLFFKKLNEVTCDSAD